MNRKETTEFLSKLLERGRLSGPGKYWAKEVTIGYGTSHPIRVDYMQFEPPNQCSVGALEKGIFICYEIKSCVEDFHSGFGQNYIGEKNFLVMPMATYKAIAQGRPLDVGILVPIPAGRDQYDEFENPTSLDEEKEWVLRTIISARPKGRKHSMTELLFCMLRSK